MLNANQKAWANRLDKLLKSMPEGIEIIVDLDKVHVMEEGFYKREISGSEVDMMTQGGRNIRSAALYSFRIDNERVRPNSETV